MHFTVMVIADDIEKALTPFKEEASEEYLTFTEEEARLVAEYETESVEQLKDSEGKLYWPYEYRFRNKEAEDYIDPETLEKVTIPLKEMYETFDIFAEVYGGFSERDPKMGKYGCWSNPNAKWDWYQVGGRWYGSLLLKQDTDLDTAWYRVGEPSWGNPDARSLRNGRYWVDAAEAGIIDWEGMRAIHLEEGRSNWTKFQAKLSINPDDKWSAYEHDIYWHADENRFDTEEEYLERFTAFYTFALLYNGEWVDKGWTRAENIWKDWQKRVDSLLASLKPTDKIWIVDCHS